MQTTIKQSFFSEHDESSIAAEMEVSWGLFGAGGGGSSSKSHSDSWKKSESTSHTFIIGGDPKISNWTNKEEWDSWVLSVETNKPARTSFALTELHRLVLKIDHKRGDNVRTAVNEYAAKNNHTHWAPAPPANLQMSWCDCEDTYWGSKYYNQDDYELWDLGCPTGKVLTRITGTSLSSHDGYQFIPNWYQNNVAQCCRPCFQG